jgi:ribose transport system substrate-binding protein
MKVYCAMLQPLPWDFLPISRAAIGRILGLALAAVTAVGCIGSETTVTTKTAPSASKGTVYVSVLTLNNPFFKTIGDSIEQELKKAGYETQVTDGAMSVTEQQRQVNDFLVAKAAAIVLCPCDSKAIGPVIQKANEAGVPVFTADIACLAPEAKVVSHIATDNLGGGRLAGEAMIEALGEAGGKVVVLDYKAAESCLLRVQGFKEVIEEHNAQTTSGKIEIVAELPGDGDRAKGFKATEDALQSHGDLVGIFAINDPSALGAYDALEKAEKVEQVKIIGFDGQDFGKEAIRDGKIYADPIQDPVEIGRKTAESILMYFRGEEVPAEQLIPTTLYRQADAQADPSLAPAK